MLNPGVIGAFIPIVIFMIPIVAIMASHQQKMAQIIHGGGGASREIEAMRKELQDLRQLVNEQALMLDNMNGYIRSLGQSNSVPPVQVGDR